MLFKTSDCTNEGQVFSQRLTLKSENYVAYRRITAMVILI